MPAHQINAGYPTWTPPAPGASQPGPPIFPGLSEHTWPMDLLTRPAPVSREARRPWLHFVTYPIVLVAGVAIGMIPQQEPGGPASVSATSDLVATDSTGTNPAGAVPMPATTFTDGTFVVGEDITPGRYVTNAAQGTLGCYWARLADTSGNMSAILANDNIRGQTTVTIQASDGAFESSGGCTWTRR